MIKLSNLSLPLDADRTYCAKRPHVCWASVRTSWVS